ncbi:MAG: hypothetical protein FWF51_08020 [Chitinivibrionia bacterium]|nr:hypothetical protein [Chitinivibrionia bacterium]
MRDKYRNPIYNLEPYKEMWEWEMPEAVFDLDYETFEIPDEVYYTELL